jgi:hypothetical protein
MLLEMADNRCIPLCEWGCAHAKKARSSSSVSAVQIDTAVEF